MVLCTYIVVPMAKKKKSSRDGYWKGSIPVVPVVPFLLFGSGTSSSFRVTFILREDFYIRQKRTTSVRTEVFLPAKFPIDVLDKSVLILCAHNFDIRVQLYIWSPKSSTRRLQGQNLGSLALSKGRRNFRFMAMEKHHGGRRWLGLLWLSAMSGNDVWGERRLGRRWMCSGEFAQTL
jgi:hypothetical protein